MTDKELRELDAEIHQRVMGCDAERLALILACASGCIESCEKCNGEDMPPYSTDITAAWQIVEKVNCFGWSLKKDPGGYYANFLIGEPGVEACAIAESAPLAICLAARKVVP